MILLKFIFLLNLVICFASPETRKTSRKLDIWRNRMANKAISVSYEILQYQWESFKSKFNKKYDSQEEEIKRLQIFTENSKFIAEHNERYNKGAVTYGVGMNKFGDWTPEERMRLLGYNARRGNNTNNVVRNKISIQYYTPPSGITIPKEKDWRRDGAVTNVQNQGKCGSGWAFSATGSLEGQYFHKTKRLVDLSEQNLIDCSYAYGNDGCDGGIPSSAFKYIEINGGIDTEASYPYEECDGKCRYEETFAGATTMGYQTIPAEESVLEKAICDAGPISVSIDAAGHGFHFYKEGIYYNKTCLWEYEDLNHAVLIVGFGYQNNSGNFWMAKNSWGEDWGDDGYIRMAKNRENNCGIVTDAVLPTVKTLPIN